MFKPKRLIEVVEPKFQQGEKRDKFFIEKLLRVPPFRLLPFPRVGVFEVIFPILSWAAALYPHISLGELLKTKSVVMAFYTEDHTPECQGELTLFKEEYSVFEFLDAEVLGIGVDTLASHRAFLQQLGNLPYPLVSDRGRTLGTTYGVLDETGKRYRRAVYIINRWGNIALIIPEFEPGNQDQYMYILQALGLNVLDDNL